MTRETDELDMFFTDFQNTFIIFFGIQSAFVFIYNWAFTRLGLIESF